MTMNLIVGLPKTSSYHNTIWIIVDKLTKSAHFLAVNTTYSTNKLARLYIEEIVRLHDIPDSLVSDRDPCFTS